MVLNSGVISAAVQEILNYNILYDWDFRISDLVKTFMELVFNPCGEFR